MATSAGLGMLLAMLAGAMNALGAILQKSAVNQIIARQLPGSFTRQFSRDPVWLSGLGASLGLGTIFNLAAQNRIGPALTPALTASGMIWLALGSARLLGEKLTASEWLGIFSLVSGIGLLGASGLQIAANTVNLLDPGLQGRLAAFSLGLVILWLLLWGAARRLRGLLHGLALALGAGLPFCLSNLWILPMLISFGPVFQGQAQATERVIFVLACLTLILSNLLGIRLTQEAYRFAPANKAQPLQQIPTQVAPILIFLLVFERSLSPLAAWMVPAGVGLILAGGFLLGRRRF